MSALDQESRLPPTGIVTFLFTDIEGSTRNWEWHPAEMAAALTAHNTVLRRGISANRGTVFETAGDSFVAIFERAPDALSAALDAQRALADIAWPDSIGPLKVRMALHTGPAEMRPDGYYAQHTLSRLSRILASGHGGQVLVSSATRDLIEGSLPVGVELSALGEHRLKDLIAPQQIFQVTAPEPPWRLPVAFPPLRTLDARPNNLPAQLTALIGREKQVAEVVAMLVRPDARSGRIVTLTGPGGTGKTRVGLQAAAELIDTFDHGVGFVDLAPISDVDLVASTLATSLGITEVADEPLLDTLEGNLRDKRMLLLVDNFEQVSAAAPQVSRLAGAAPGVKVLVTSRVPLRITGENEYPIPPLPLPDLRRLPPLEELTQYDAVRLFVERATAIHPEFRVTNDNAQTVAEICVRLDGLPLAIELAAARIRLMPPQAIAARLHNRFALLTGGPRDAEARQRTLRAAIDWSFDLLGDAEQQLFRRLAVFVGGRTLAAIEAVCGPGLPIDVLDGVDSLVHNNLLRHEEGGAVEPRFTMLETIHEFALEKLAASGEIDELQHRHASYFLDLAEATRLEPGTGPREVDDLEQLQIEQDNLRSALRWAVAGAAQGVAARADVAIRLAAALARFWFVRGHWQEGGEWATEVLAKAGTGNTRARARLLFGAGQLAVERGDYPSGRALFEQSVQAYRDAGDLDRAAFALGKVGDSTYAEGDFAAARPLLEEALAQSRALGNTSNVGRLLSNLGELMRAQGDYAAARRLNEEALELLTESGHRSSSLEIIPLCNLGNALLREGDVDRASSVLADTLAMADRLGSTSNVALALLGLAGVAAVRDAPERAARLFGAADTVIDALGAKLWPADRLDYEHHLSIAQQQLGDAEFEAARREGRALRLNQAVAYALDTTSAPPT
ncbi:MAG TPA: tetratricopeptide repeat protein [Jatrophihabitantaceae bacterium]|nr:tetratricopeptide repeat protein [Jatrophihabitantaceae bacterium]